MPNKYEILQSEIDNATLPELLTFIKERITATDTESKVVLQQVSAGIEAKHQAALEHIALLEHTLQNLGDEHKKLQIHCAWQNSALETANNELAASKNELNSVGKALPVVEAMLQGADARIKELEQSIPLPPITPGFDMVMVQKRQTYGLPVGGNRKSIGFKPQD